MPIIIENNFDRVSLRDLVRLMNTGYSVLKSPHVGNQHPSNLVCAALGIPLEMVSFTKGIRDQNFHPHVRIEGGEQYPLASPHTWTQFAQTSDGQTLTSYHQEAVKRVFPGVDIATDMERMRQYPALTAMVLQATNVRRAQSVWYRKVSETGVVTSRSQGFLEQVELETNVFQFSNDRSGWVVPNKLHIIFDFVYQSLSSGRDTIYHLSGPQMVEYIATLGTELEVLYDAVRQVIPQLPLVLRVRMVPVASARFVTNRADVEGLSALASVRDQVSVPEVVQEFALRFPMFTLPIESGRTMSQYDLSSADDVVLDEWMLNAPLREVAWLHTRLQQFASAVAAE